MIRPQNLEQEIRRTTEAIRRVFAVEGDLDEAGAEKLHEMFVECINTVNIRLRHCDELLRKGLRQEALQECEVPANFLDLVTELDIPEWNAWADYVRQFGIPPQQPLLIDVAAELNHAFVQAQSLGQVLRLYRLHALARSPLSVRLDVLRTIADRDPDNPVWRDDIQTFETARIREVGSELQQHILQENVRGVAALRKEIGSGKWQTAPPPTLVQRVVKAHQKLVAQDARRQLQLLAPLIDAAYSGFNVAKSEELRDQWDRLAETAQLSADDELNASVAQAFNWLDQDRGRRDLEACLEQSVAELESGLDDTSIKQPELTRLMAAAQQYGPIPDDVQRRCDEKLLMWNSARRRRSLLRWTALASTVLVLAAAAAGGVWWQYRTGEINDLNQKLVEHAKQRNYQAGIDFYDKQVAEKPYLANDATVQAAFGDLQTKLKEEKSRAEKFTQHINAAQSLVQNGDWPGVEGAQKELAGAEKIVGGKEEKERLAKANSAVKEVKDRLQKSADAHFHKEFDKIKNSLGPLRQMNSADVEGLIAEAKALQDQKHNPADGQEELASVINRLKARLESIQNRANMESAIDKIAQSINSTSYKNDLESYIRKWGDEHRANDFRKVLAGDLKDENVAKLDDWNKVARAWNSVGLLDDKDQSEAIKTLETLKSKYSNYPGVVKVLSVKPYVESLGDRAHAQRMRDNLLQDDLFNMLCIKRKKKPMLYFFGDVGVRTDNGGTAVFGNWLTDHNDFKKIDSTHRRINIEEIEEVDKDKYVRDSPQKRFAIAARKIIKDTKMSYDEQCCNILIELVNTPDMEPILQAFLLQLFIEHFTEGSSLLKKEIKPIWDEIYPKTDLHNKNWLSQEHSLAELRDRLKTSLGLNRDSFKAKWDGPISFRVENYIKKPPKLPTFRWMAMLIKEETGRWVCRTSHNTSLPNGKAFVYDASQTKVDPFREIGVVSGSQIKLEVANDSFYEGRPVYFIQ